MLTQVKHGVERFWWPVLAYTIAIKYIFLEFIGSIFGRYGKSNNKDYPRHDGKEAIVTGGSRGIGLEIVKCLLSHGYKVTIGSSSSEKSRLSLEETLKTNFPGSSVEVWHLDLASLKSANNFCEKYLSTRSSLHLLVNNAGIMFVNEEITEDGFEKHFSVNYLSHCLLTLRLLPLLKKSSTKEANARIVNSSSCIHFVGSKDVKKFTKGVYYSKYKAYIQSKLAQVLFTYSLQDYLDRNNINVKVNCLHPGVVNTELMTSVLLIPSLASLFFKSAKQGAETAEYAALSPEMEGVGGKYLEECQITASSKVSQDAALQKQLWVNTLKVLDSWIGEME